MEERKFDLPRELSFSITAKTARLLGRESISSPVIAILELVKNAYDADASHVKIEFIRASAHDGRMRIVDDGVGMNLNDLQDNWMVIGTDIKERQPLSARNRVKVGEKGIGRLALDRLASVSVLETKVAEVDFGLRLTIDWAKYEGTNHKLHEIYHPLERFPSSKGEHGTSLSLKGLRDQWSRHDIEKLYGDLSLLVPPFEESSPDFSIEFVCDDAPDLTGHIGSTMPAAAEYTLKSELTSDNRIKHTLTHRSGIVKEDSRSWEEAFAEEANNGPYCGPLHLELYFYLREAGKLRDADIKRADIIKFLERYQGVRIYRDGMRVKPYGDPRDDRDWLGLNASKAGSPEAVTGRLGQYRVWGNQIVGSLRISRIPNPELRDQTNREGLIENRAYWDMRRFILHGVRFLEYERQKYEKERKQAEKTPVFQQVVSEVEEELESRTAAVEKDIKESALISPAGMEALKVLQSTKPMVTKLREAHEEEVADLMSENQMLTGLATLGIALVVFGHETSQSINALIARSNLLSSTIAQLPVDFKDKLQNDINGIGTAIQRVESWGQFALNHVRRDKRTSRNLDVNSICDSVFDGFSSLFNSRSIKMEKYYGSDIPKLRGFAMDIEGIIINLITNSVEALRPTPLENRLISVTTKFDNSSSLISLIFADSGKGILEQDIGKIFQPLFTTRVDRDGQPTGTGMGLKIIKNIVEQYGGKIEVKGHGDLGGAAFYIYIPIRPQEGRRD